MTSTMLTTWMKVAAVRAAGMSGMQLRPRLLLHTALPLLLLLTCILHEQGCCCQQAVMGAVRPPPRAPLPASRREAPQTEARRQQQLEGLLEAFRAASCKL